MCLSQRQGGGQGHPCARMGCVRTSNYSGEMTQQREEEEKEREVGRDLEMTVRS